MDPKLWKLLSITYSCDASYYCYVVEPHPTTNTRQA